jgi:hypothetical protein
MILEYSLGTYTLFETEWSEEGDSITGKGKTWYPNLTLLEMLEILRVYNCWRDSDKTEQIIHINNTSINLYWRGKTFKGYRFE